MADALVKILSQVAGQGSCDADAHAIPQGAKVELRVEEGVCRAWFTATMASGAAAGPCPARERPATGSEPRSSRPHMPPTAPFSTSRTEIAGVAVADLARRFGTPTFVYDAATIAPARARPGRLRSRALRPEGLLEPGHSRPAPPPGVPGRCGQRGRDPPRLGGRLFAPRPSAAHRLYGRHLRRRGPGTVHGRGRSTSTAARWT